MLKKISVFFLVIIVFTLFTTNTLAQGLTFDRAYQDYLFTRTTYEASFREFEAARNAYLGNPTLSLKDEARVKTLAMLRNRDQLMSTYLTALRTRLSELPALNRDVSGAILGRIDAEVLWYTNHKTNYKEDDQLEALFSKSDEAKEEYKSKTSFLVNESLFNISLGEEQGLRLSHEEIYTSLKALIDKKVAEGTLTMSPFTNWFTDIEKTIQNLKETESKGETEIKKMYNQSNPSSKFYESSVQVLSTTVQPLAQFNQFLTEVLTYIKNQ